MALGRADGSIIINTKILEAGFDKGMSSIKNKLGGFGRFANNTLGKTADTIDNRINSAMDRTADKVKKIGALVASAFAIGKLIGFAKEAIELGSDLAEVENVTSTVFPNMSRDVDEWAISALDAYGLTRTMAKNYVGTFGAMSKAFGFSERKAYEMSTALAGLSGDVASFYNLSQDEAFTKLKSIFTGETESLKSLGVVMTQTALDQYAMANGFGKTTANMTEQEKVSLRLAFVTDKLGAAAGDFTKTQDSWANQTKILSARFTELKTAIGQGLINLFTPIIKGINTLLSYLYTAAEAFNTFTATLMGKSRSGGGGVAGSGGGGVAQAASDTAQAIGDVADNTAGAADATDDYAGAAKKAQKAARGYLSTLDEVNKFTSDIASDADSSSSPKSGKGTGGSGKSGSGSPAAGLESIYDPSNFAVDEMAEPLSEFAQKLRDAFLAGDWEGLGRIIGQKVNEVMAKIKDAISWDNVGPAITKFVDAFTRTFNSLVSTINWHLIGETFATGINTIVYTLLLLVEGINWNLLGMSFAKGINGVIDELDWKAYGALLGERFMIMWRMFLGFVFTLDWEKLGESIKTSIYSALDHIDMDEIFLAMSGFGTGLALFLNNLISPDLFGQVAGKITEGLNSELAFLDEFGTHFNFDNFGDSIGEAINKVFIEFDFEKLGKVLAVFAKGLLRALERAAVKISWKNIGTKIADGINTFFQEFQFTELSQTANLFLSSILDGLISLGSEIHWKDIGTNIGNGLRDFLWNFDPEAKIGTAIRVFVNGLFAALSKFFLKVNFGSLLEIVKTKLQTELAEINLAEIGGSIIETIWSGMTGEEMDESAKENVKKSFDELNNVLSTIVSYTFDNIQSFYTNVLVPLGKWILGEGLPELARIIANTFGKIDWDGLKEGFDKLYKAIQPFVEGIGKGLLDFLDFVSTTLTVGFSWLVGLATSAIDLLFGTIDDEDKDFISGIGEALGILLGAFTMYEITSSIYNGISNLATHLPALLTAITTHPVLAVIAGAAAVGTAIYTLWENANKIKNVHAQNIKSTADAIDQLAGQLSSTTIKADTDYQYIMDVLDKYWELNTLLKENSSLDPTDQTLYEGYASELASYSAEMQTAIGEIGSAYAGTRGELEALIEKQYEAQRVEAYKDIKTEYMHQKATLEVELGELQREMREKIQEALDAAMNDENFGEDFGFNIPLDFDYNREDIEQLMQLLVDTGLETDGLTGKYQLMMQILNLSGLNVATHDWTDYATGVNTANEKIEEVNGTLETIDEMIKDVQSDTKDASKSTGEDLEFVGTETKKAADKFYDGTKSMSDSASGFMRDMREGAEKQVGPLLHVFSDVVGNVKKSITDGWGIKNRKSSVAEEQGSAYVEGAEEGVEKKKTSLWESIKAVARGSSKTYSDELGISNGTSTVMEEAGQSTVTGISEGSEDKKSGLLKIFEELPDEMMGMMGDLMEEFKFPGRIIISGIRRGILNNKQALFDDIANLIPRMSEQLASLNSIMWTIGYNAAQNLANGFKSVHIPRPVFGVGTQWSNVAGTIFPVPAVNVTWMASGGVIPRNASRFLAGLGDNNHETEVVSPLSTIRQAVNEALLEAGMVGSKSNSKPLKIQIDGRTVFDAVINEAKSRQDRTGYNPFDL